MRFLGDKTALISTIVFTHSVLDINEIRRYVHRPRGSRTLLLYDWFSYVIHAFPHVSPKKRNFMKFATQPLEKQLVRTSQKVQERLISWIKMIQLRYLPKTALTGTSASSAFINSDESVVYAIFRNRLTLRLFGTRFQKIFKNQSIGRLLRVAKRNFDDHTIPRFSD